MEDEVTCVHCQAANPADARFCIECGRTIAEPTTGPTVQLRTDACPTCGTVNPTGARFCAICGRGLIVAQPEPQPLLPHVPVTPQPNPVPSLPFSPPILIVGVMAVLLLVITRGVALPLILFGLAGALLLSAIARGRSADGLGWMIWVIGIPVLIVTKMIWPGILVLIGLNWLLGSMRGNHRSW